LQKNWINDYYTVCWDSWIKYYDSMMGYSEENFTNKKEMMKATVSSLSQMVEGMIADSSWDILSSTPPPSSNFFLGHTNFSLNEELFVANNESYDLGTTDSPDHSDTSGELGMHPLNWGNVALVCVFCSIIAGTVVSCKTFFWLSL